MANSFKNILIAALVGAATMQAVAAPSKKGYDLVWEDHFEGVELNRAYWNVEVNGTGCGNHELQYYIDNPQNVAVRNGNLVLTARRADYDGHAFTSGRINTQGKVAFSYGIIEARILLPETTDGLWPAFWMMGNDIKENGWPKCGETDILEMGHADGIAAGTQSRLFNGAMHWGEAPQYHCQQVAPKTSEKSLQDGKYHIFTVLWTPDKIEMYVDNQKEPYMRALIGESSDKHSYFNKDNYILFNLAVGGDFPGIHNPDGVTALSGDGASAEMLVDYVKVYQPKNNVTLKLK